MEQSWPALPPDRSVQSILPLLVSDTKLSWLPWIELTRSLVDQTGIVPFPSQPFAQGWMLVYNQLSSARDLQADKQAKNEQNDCQEEKAQKLHSSTEYYRTSIDSLC